MPNPTKYEQFNDLVLAAVKYCLTGKTYFTKSVFYFVISEWGNLRPACRLNIQVAIQKRGLPFSRLEKKVMALNLEI